MLFRLFVAILFGCLVFLIRWKQGFTVVKPEVMLVLIRI